MLLSCSCCFHCCCNCFCCSRITIKSSPCHLSFFCVENQVCWVARREISKVAIGRGARVLSVLYGVWCGVVCVYGLLVLHYSVLCLVGHSRHRKVSNTTNFSISRNERVNEHLSLSSPPPPSSLSRSSSPLFFFLTTCCLVSQLLGLL